MHRLPFLALLASTVLSALYVLTTVGELPRVIATHFGGSGAANGWMSRPGYTVFMLCFTVLFPLLTAAMAGALPRRYPNLTNLPNRDYWMDPSRRDATLTFLAEHACWLGCLIAGFGAAIHRLIVLVHRHRSPLPADQFLITVGVFLGALACWSVLMLLRFRGPTSV